MSVEEKLRTLTLQKFEWRADETYVLDRASGYTLSIGPIAR